jgi:hypothetical protein
MEWIYTSADVDIARPRSGIGEKTRPGYRVMPDNIGL